jgi:hypothetical protein
VAAEEAARSAARSADVDEQTLALARLGRHHELGPGLPSVLDAVLVDGNQCMPLVTAREYAVTVTVIAAGRRIVFPLNRIGPRRVSVRLDSHEPDVWRGERVEGDLWRPGSMSARTIGPTRAGAVRECQAAVESEAQRRVTSANSGSGGAAATVGGVDMSDPVWSQPAWKVDATIRFTIVSIFGQTPATVYVRCTASRSGGRTSTSISSR